MQLTKTERVLKTLSGALSPPLKASPIFEDSHLASKLLNPNKLELTQLTFARQKAKVRVRSLHEKAKADTTQKNVSQDLSNSLLKKQPTFHGRKGTTTEIKIHNLEVLNKLKTLCSSYLINPESLQSRMVKCLIKSLKTLNEYFSSSLLGLLNIQTAWIFLTKSSSYLCLKSLDQFSTSNHICRIGTKKSSLLSKTRP